MATKVKIYSTATCAYCHAEKEFLKQHHIPFEDIAVDTDVEAAREMVELSGQMGVPFTVIEHDGKEEHIVGFDQARIAAALGL